MDRIARPAADDILPDRQPRVVHESRVPLRASPVVFVSNASPNLTGIVVPEQRGDAQHWQEGRAASSQPAEPRGATGVWPVFYWPPIMPMIAESLLTANRARRPRFGDFNQDRRAHSPRSFGSNPGLAGRASRWIIVAPLAPCSSGRVSRTSGCQRGTHTTWVVPDHEDRPHASMASSSGGLVKLEQP